MIITAHQIFVLFVFFVTYGFIISEKIHRTLISLFSAVMVVFLGFIDLDSAFHFIDFNTICLLIGMMIIVYISKETGLFDAMAVKIIKISNGNPLIIFFTFILATGCFSAVLDNVTTVLFMIPISFLVIKMLKIPAYPFIMGEILASNIGGTATLVGDPPNILIGSKNNLSFNDFLVNLGPISFIVLLFFLFFLYFRYGKLIPRGNLIDRIKGFDEEKSISDKKLLIVSVIIIVFTLIGFITAEFIHIEPGTTALFFATLLMFYTKKDPMNFFKHVEWNTIFFLIGLFVLVGSLEHSGIMKIMAKYIVGLTKNRLYLCILILWTSGIISAFLDNIPFVLTMIPILQSVIGPEHMNLSVTQSMPLWWSLALGACLGGNGTLVGASANIIVCGMSNKFQPGLITFKSFFRLGIPVMFISLILSTFFIRFMYF